MINYEKLECGLFDGLNFVKCKKTIMRCVEFCLRGGEENTFKAAKENSKIWQGNFFSNGKRKIENNPKNSWSSQFELACL